MEQSSLSAEEVAQLRWAHQHLEHPSLAARLSNIIGTPIEQGLRLLPASWYQRLDTTLDAVTCKTLLLAISTMDKLPPTNANDKLHKLLAIGSGVVGGLLGPLTLLAELPLMTTVILRSIADIAYYEGEDLTTKEARLACMQVFALGGRTKEDEAADAGYFGLRTMLGLHFSPSVLNFGAGDVVSLPAGIDFIRAISSRFGTVISDKAGAQMIPVAGAVTGALLNYIFMQHFQDIARGHFIIRRLERKHGSNIIKKHYQKITKENDNSAKSYSTLEGW
jgi:hypothetical protein